MQRTLLIALAAVLFVAASLFVGRWLNTENVERAEVTGLLREQARGDAAAMLRRLECRDAACARLARVNARRLRSRGELEIARYDSGTSHALGSTTGPTRVVWTAPGRLTVVQCVVVRRDGNPVAGTSVTLLRVSAPIGREAGCR